MTAYISHNENCCRVPGIFGSVGEIIGAVAGELADEGGEVAYRAICVVEAGIRQRWLVVHSRAARRRAEKTLKKRHLKQGEAELKAFGRQGFACEEDAQAALDAFEKSLKLAEVHEGRIARQTHHAKKGRPAKDREPERVSYAVEGQLASLQV